MISSAPTTPGTIGLRRKSGDAWQGAHNGDIFMKRYAGWYSVRDEAFYNEKRNYASGTRRRSPSTSGHTGGVVRRRTRVFFRLSAYQDKLLAHYEQNPDFILPRERRERSREFRQGRPGRFVGFAHDPGLGHTRYPATYQATSCTFGLML